MQGGEGRIDRSHGAAIAAECCECRLLHQRVDHWLREDVVVPCPGSAFGCGTWFIDRCGWEDVRPRARAPAHTEFVAWGGRAMAGRVEVLRRVYGARVRLTGRRLKEHLVETDVAPAARVGVAAGRVPL